MKVNSCKLNGLEVSPTAYNACTFQIIDNWDPSQYAKTCDTMFYLSDGTGAYVWDCDHWKFLDFTGATASDWNAEENEAGFIKNRPFKTLGHGLSVDENGVLTSTSSVTSVNGKTGDVEIEVSGAKSVNDKEFDSDGNVQVNATDIMLSSVNLETVADFLDSLTPKPFTITDTTGSTGATDKTGYADAYWVTLSNLAFYINDPVKVKALMTDSNVELGIISESEFRPSSPQSAIAMITSKSITIDDVKTNNDLAILVKCDIATDGVIAISEISPMPMKSDQVGVTFLDGTVEYLQNYTTLITQAHDGKYLAPDSVIVTFQYSRYLRS
jgi:hypothetical protein